MYDLVNLTLPKAIQTIEEVLDDYPEYPYKSIFSIHQLKQKLIAHVLSSVPNQYVINGDVKPPNNLNTFPTSPIAERLRLEIVIRGSILHILRENADLVNRLVIDRNKVIN